MVWLSVEDREFLLQKFRFAGFDHMRESVQDSRATWRPGPDAGTGPGQPHPPARPNNAVPRGQPPFDMAVSIGSMAYGRARRACLATPFASFKSSSRGRSPGPINHLATDRHISGLPSPG